MTSALALPARRSGRPGGPQSWLTGASTRPPKRTSWRATAAFEAFGEVMPEMSEEQAKVEATQAIAYAAANHTEWFWRGA